MGGGGSPSSLLLLPHSRTLFRRLLENRRKSPLEVGICAFLRHCVDNEYATWKHNNATLSPNSLKKEKGNSTNSYIPKLGRHVWPEAGRITPTHGLILTVHTAGSVLGKGLLYNKRVVEIPILSLPSILYSSYFRKGEWEAGWFNQR